MTSPAVRASFALSLLAVFAASACRSTSPEPAPAPTATGTAPAVEEPPPVVAPDAGMSGEPSAGGACKTDADCVPAACCHATSCVARGPSAPDCKAVMCTMECRANTLDCGGRCLCQNGQCAAKLGDTSGGAPQ